MQDTVDQLVSEACGERLVGGIAMEAQEHLRPHRVADPHRPRRHELVERLRLHEAEAISLAKEKDDRLAEEQVLAFGPVEETTHTGVIGIEPRSPPGRFEPWQVGVDQEVVGLHGLEVHCRPAQNPPRLVLHPPHGRLLFFGREAGPWFSRPGARFRAERAQSLRFGDLLSLLSPPPGFRRLAPGRLDPGGGGRVQTQGAAKCPFSPRLALGGRQKHPPQVDPLLDIVGVDDSPVETPDVLGHQLGPRAPTEGSVESILVPRGHVTADPDAVGQAESHVQRLGKRTHRR